MISHDIDLLSADASGSARPRRHQRECDCGSPVVSISIRFLHHLSRPISASGPPPQPGVALPKPTTRFVCQSCGAVTPKWTGRCETCGEWNSVEPEPITPRPGPGAKAPAGQSVSFVGLRGDAAPPPRA